MTEQNIQPRILLIGDTCVDEYRYGVVERISPEAPVPVFKLFDVELKSGMASNVEKNLKALGCNVISYYGDASHKTRLIDKKSKQHLIRIDDDVISKPLTIDDIREKDFDAIVISDYNKGAITYKLIEDLKNSFKTVPIFIDTKKQSLDLFEGCFVKINELEFEKAKSYNDDLIVTMGDKGARYKNVTYPAARVEVSDVTGAGDTFLSALAYEYLNTKSISKAIEFALKASSVTVQHMGCYAPTLEEICD